jgi:fimbrial chaperone protein
MLRVRNSGTQRAQIGALELSNAAGQQFVIAPGLFGYVLAGRCVNGACPRRATPI